MHRERSTMKVFEDPEWQAWRFAHAFCMPARTVIKAVNKWGTGPEGINALVETFDMNPAFVRTRLKMLKIIPADRAMISGKRNMPGIQMFRQTGGGLMDNLCVSEDSFNSQAPVGFFPKETCLCELISLATG